MIHVHGRGAEAGLVSWRLWRRKRLLPGVSLGLSRSGPSVRFGVRGAGITLGGRYGVRTTVGIPGSGVYYTAVPRRSRRAAPATRSSYPMVTTSSRSTAIGFLVLIGTVVAVGAAIATSGIALVPIAIVLAVWGVYRHNRASSKAARLISAATKRPPAETVPILHQAMTIDPAGRVTLARCGDWFYAHECWQDATDAFAGYLHLAPSLDAEAKYVESLLYAGHLDEAIARLDQLRVIPTLTDESRATLLSALAQAWILKGDLPQARAVLDSAGLQKRHLDIGLQQCLALRAICNYLQGQKARATADLDRLYAVNPAYPNLPEWKAEMAAGTFELGGQKVFPDWYPHVAADDPQHPTGLPDQHAPPDSRSEDGPPA